MNKHNNNMQYMMPSRDERLKLIPKFAPGIDPRLSGRIVHDIVDEGLPLSKVAQTVVGFRGSATDVGKLKSVPAISVEFFIARPDEKDFLVFGEGPILEVAKLHGLPFVKKVVVEPCVPGEQLRNE